MNNTSLILIILGLAVSLCAGLLRTSHRLWILDESKPKVTFLGANSPVLTWLKYRGEAGIRLDPLVWAQAKPRLMAALEIFIIGAWAFWVGRPYLDFDPDVLPRGGEFLMSSQANYGWQFFQKCGGCFFWNGFTNGGAPAFVDLHSDWLHPLVTILTLLLGVIPAAKLTVLFGFWLAGIAQWWLAKILRLGLLPRLWSACLVSTAGHLTGRMDAGLVPLVLSTASCSLIIPAVLHLVISAQRRAALVLAVAIALAILSGQGYLQLGLLLNIFPALLILVIGDKPRFQALWKEFILAGLLGLLLTAVLLVPLAHFWPNLAKDTDPNFLSAQPLAYSPVNLVIDDPDFFYMDKILGKQPYPYLYTSYIGWVPVILALLSFRFVPRNRQRLFYFFWVSIGLMYCFGSALTLKAISMVWSASWIRNPSLVSGLAVPLIVALAAWTLDEILKKNWPKLIFSYSQPSEGDQPRTFLGFKSAWLLAIPLLWSLFSVADFASEWITVVKPIPETETVMPWLTPTSSQWVQPPWGEYTWTDAAMNAHVKLAFLYRPWHWHLREFPQPFLKGERNPVDSSFPGLLGQVSGINILKFPENEYAHVITDQGNIPCQANAMGGNIDVTCQTDLAGELVVWENNWSGWSVSRDGAPTELGKDTLLTVEAPAGRHQYTFRYQPWDVPTGIALSLLGVILTIALWFRTGPGKPFTPQVELI